MPASHVSHTPFGNISFKSNDRLDTCALARLVEVDRAVHGAVIGERQTEAGPVRGHGRPGGMRLDRRAGVFAVDVQVDNSLLPHKDFC